MRPTLVALTLAAVLVPSLAQTQTPTPSPGPIVADFGPVYTVAAPGLATPLGQELKLRFDVSETAADPKALNARLETAARFLNMHGQAGVSPDLLKLAIVVHGTASKDVLSNDAYRARHGIDNPNLPLLVALKKSGVRIYLCGQSAGSRGIAASEMAAPVEMALSAMTAHLVLNAEGYVLNPF